jgi:hypothetical protein
MPQKGKWTILTYIAAHNNLDLLGQHSRNEILKVGSTPEVTHGVLYDGHVGAARYVMGEPGTVSSQEPLQSFDSGDPDALIDVAKWLFAKYPAERYGVVLWSHGTGWEPSEIQAVGAEARPGAATAPTEARERSVSSGSLVLFRSTLRSLLTPAKHTERAILFDDGTGHSLDTLELARVARTIGEATGQPLEFLGMDACLMASVEVAFELRGSARYLVASEELVPGHSWPYQSIYGALRAEPEQDGGALARRVVDEYVGFFEKNPPGAGDVTKVALDLSRLDSIVQSSGALADALKDDIAHNADALWQAQFGARNRETSNGKRANTKFQYHLWDLGSLAAGLAASGATDAVRRTAADVVKQLVPGAGGVIREGHRGEWFDGISGVSVYLMPPGEQRVAPSYSQLGFAKATRWDEMLSAYHAQLA